MRDGPRPMSFDSACADDLRDRADRCSSSPPSSSPSGTSRTRRGARHEALLAHRQHVHDNIFDMHEKDAAAFQAWLRVTRPVPSPTLSSICSTPAACRALDRADAAPTGTRVALSSRRCCDRSTEGRVVRDGRRPRAPHGCRRGRRRQPMRRALAQAKLARRSRLSTWCCTPQQLPQIAGTLRNACARPRSAPLVAVVALTTSADRGADHRQRHRALRRLTRAVATLSAWPRRRPRGRGNRCRRRPAELVRPADGFFKLLLDICPAPMETPLRHADHFQREGVGNPVHVTPSTRH